MSVQSLMTLFRGRRGKHFGGFFCCVLSDTLMHTATKLDELDVCS